LPLLYYATGMRRWSGMARAAFFLSLAIAYCFCCARWWNFEIPSLALKPGQHVRLIMFVAGILVCEALSWGPKPSLSRWLEFGAICALVVPLLAIPLLRGTAHGNVIQAAVLFLTFAGLVLCCLDRPDGLLGRLFSWTPLRWLGNMSYSYYLSHAFVLHFVIRGLSRSANPPSPEKAWGLLAISFVATWLGATLLFICVEKPFSFGAMKSANPASREQTTGIAPSGSAVLGREAPSGALEGSSPAGLPVQ